GYGCNVQAGWSQSFALKVLRLQVEERRDAIQQYSWFAKCSPTRRSVLLDIAFNDGVEGLLHFPHMLSAIDRADWVTAKQECAVQNPELAGRYADLGNLLLQG